VRQPDRRPSGAVRYVNRVSFYGGHGRWWPTSSVIATVALLCIPSAVASSVSSHVSVARVVGWGPAEHCAGAITVTDAKNDTRSWTLPAPPGRAVIPPSADLRRFELRATAAGVCVRWTTAAPAPPGTVLVFSAHGPPIRQPGGATVSHGYGFELELRKNGARATFGLDRLGFSAPRILRVRVGRTGSVVSAFVRKTELDRPPANMPDRPPFPYRAFSFEARVLSVPDARGNRRADFWPRERLRVALAAYINGRLCAPPCRDPRFRG
jgi:hypothetical protein